MPRLLPLALLLAGIGQAKADLSVAVYQSGDATNYGTTYTGSNAVIKAAYDATVAQASGLTATATFTTTSLNYNWSFANSRSIL